VFRIIETTAANMLQIRLASLTTKIVTEVDY